MPDSMGTSSIWKRLIMLRMRSPPNMRNMLSSRLRKNLVLPGSPCLHNDCILGPVSLILD